MWGGWCLVMRGGDEAGCELAWLRRFGARWTFETFDTPVMNTILVCIFTHCFTLLTVLYACFRVAMRASQGKQG